MRKLLNLWFLVAAMAIGCSTDSLPIDGDMPMSDAGSDGSLRDLAVELPDFPPGFIKQIQISPASANLEVTAGAQTPMQQFTAIGITDSNEQISIPAGAWAIDAPETGAISAVGLFTPSGAVGGAVKVSLKINDVEGTATLNVKLTVKVGPEPPAETKTAFDNATDEDPNLTVIYPYNNTVFPRGLSAPVLQWTGGSANDLYRIHITGSGFDLTAYTMAAPPSSFSLPSNNDIWDKLTASSAGTDVRVDVQRHDGSRAYKAKSQTWKIANANLRGAIYYTQLSGNEETGSTDIMRIRPGANAEQFLERPSGTKCIACHSLSANGERIVTAVGVPGESGWSVFDTKTGQKLYENTFQSWFEAISPTGSHILWRHKGGPTTNGSLILSTATNNFALATLDPPDDNGLPGHPAWSPDGSKIAFSVRPAGSEPIDFTSSTLWTSDVTLSPASFSNIKKIIDSAPGFPVATYPSFSADSKWIAYMLSSGTSRTGGNTLGQIWLTSSDGVTKMQLKNIAGNPEVQNAVDNNFGPSFHPIQQGGYFWLAFFSRRPYGHKDFGGKRQIWLAAVNARPTAESDPSHPAFYITGQNQQTVNERPQFTVNACVGSGESCTVGFDCCQGLFCRPDSTGKSVCGDTNPPVCARQGDRCDTVANCCSNQGLDCINHVCDTSIQ